MFKSLDDEAMKQLNSLLDQKKSLDEKIKKIHRIVRQQERNIPSDQELLNKKKFDQQQKDGLNPAPLVPRVDLEAMVGTEVFERILDAEIIDDVIETSVRGVKLKYKAPNIRALWQSTGQEYIEPELLNFIDTIEEGESYFDIGASTGVFALYAAAKGVNTICIEPEAANFNILNYNTYLNFNLVQGSIKNFNLALSDNDCIDEIYIKKFEEAGHVKILGNPTARGEGGEFIAEYRQHVLSFRFDTFIKLFVKKLPSHIKIDVDGAEKKLVEGMGELLLDKQIQSIFIEIDDADSSSREALEILIHAGFEIKKKVRVQNYFGEHNYILERRT
tara:strand:- start:11926 stop:12921 length:996 start_codon:yes stop_codon:yes gene_type:complete